ncbi:LysR family transcriptional regulator [Celeribacter litoreus]|uniref:LysR family transcriptional regulator n=1 Tax=Celeribacter litoreus TaxID=2876714 RepID=UPI001CCFF15C|nr:LysR family transcriptional regulator [Celeribacter litoreus]MCA0043970.1 LysR family transcriptional regulator [Celeribacter litoreus]
MLDKLEMFIALAKEEHFGRAAISLGITQPTLSTGIKLLEEQLGVQLVFRGSRYGGLTPEGQNALVWARKIVSDSRQLKEEMRATRHGLSGQIRLAVVPTALTWAAQLTSQFTKAHPKLRVSILSRSSAQILSMLDHLDADAGITYLDNEPLGRVVTRPLYRERYMVVTPKDNPLAARDMLEWADLSGQRLCLFTDDMQNRRILDRHLSDAGVSPEATVESNSIVVLVAHVEAGDWITVLPEGIARYLSRGTDLALVPIDPAGDGHRVGLVAPFRDPHTPVLDALLGAAEKLSEID